MIYFWKNYKIIVTLLFQILIINSFLINFPLKIFGYLKYIKIFYYKLHSYIFNHNLFLKINLF